MVRSFLGNSNWKLRTVHAFWRGNPFIPVGMNQTSVTIHFFLCSIPAPYQLVALFYWSTSVTEKVIRWWANKSLSIMQQRNPTSFFCQIVLKHPFFLLLRHRDALKREPCKRITMPHDLSHLNWLRKSRESGKARLALRVLPYFEEH